VSIGDEGESSDHRWRRKVKHVNHLEGYDSLAETFVACGPGSPIRESVLGCHVAIQ
jgi:hypothetical protein